jgi:hypothetical protein
MAEPVRIHPVSGTKDLKAFIRVPFALYKNDPNWVPPLEMERLDTLSDKNPYFRHGEAKYWIATRGSEPVGRISAQVDRLVLETIDPKLGHIGLFECADDFEAADALFRAAEGWLRTKGMTRAQGPFNLSVNEECGVLVKGFDTPPMIMMGHGLPYYPRLYEKAGYRKAKDMFAYGLDITKRFSDKVMRFVQMGQRNPAIAIRDIDMKHYDRELGDFFSIFNDAWSGNWGFIPFTDAEGRHAAKNMKMLVAPHRVRICHFHGEPAAFMVTLPDVNAYVRDFDGKLFPFNLFKLIWRLKTKYPERVRVPLMGVRKKLQGTIGGACMVFLLIETIREQVTGRGGTFAELSWILEDNMPMRKILEEIGCVIYKTYRIYEKPL